MYGAKIRMIRELRGFSQENIAAKLGITQTTYSRIESNQTKMDTDMLEKLAKELGVTPIDILSHEPAVINFASNQGQQGNNNTIENFYSFQIELFEKIIDSKDQEIAKLQEVIASLIKDKDGLMNTLLSGRTK